MHTRLTGRVVRSRLSLAGAFLALVGGAPGCGGCPGALLQGELAVANEELTVGLGGREYEAVDWEASGYRVRNDGSELVVVDWLGIVKAREGDFVRFGGGETGQPGTWVICGMFEVVEPGPSG